MAADGPNVVLVERLMDALYQAYQAFLAAHPAERAVNILSILPSMFL
jgi:hypothetical protein